MLLFKNFFSIRTLLLATFSTLLFCGFESISNASDTKWEKMIDGLIMKRYYDTAADYIESLRNNPHVPDSFKEEIDYRKGELYVDTGLATPMSRKTFFNEAKSSFEKFIKEHPDSIKVFNSKYSIGGILIGEADEAFALYGSDRIPESQKTEMLENSRKLYNEAIKYITEAENFIKPIADKLQSEKLENHETEKILKRNDAINNFLEARSQRLIIGMRLAETYPVDSPEFKKRVEDATKNVLDFALKYANASTYGHVVARAKLEAAKGYRHQKKYDDMRRILGEVNIVEKNEATNFTLMQSLLMGLEIDFEQKKFGQAVERTEQWLNNYSSDLQDSYMGQKISLTAGKLLVAYRESMKRQDNTNLYDMVGRLATNTLGAIKPNSQFYSEAQDVLAKAGIGRTTRRAGGSSIATFYEACDEAKTDMAAVQVANRSYNHKLESKAPANEIQDAEREKNEAMEVAYESLERAIKIKEYEYMAYGLPKADDTIPSTELFDMRYNLLWLDWTNKKYLNVGVLGEFLAQKYSSNPRAQNVATFALRGYRQSFIDAQNDGEDGKAEAHLLYRFADYVTKRWSDSKLAEDAMTFRIETIIACGDLDEAVTVVESLPEGSPARAKGEMLLGSQLWSHYLKMQRAEEDERIPGEELEKLRALAKKSLDDGVKRRLELSEPVDFSTILSVFKLAQIELEDGNFDTALEWLQNPKAGPLTITEMKEIPKSISWPEIMKTETMTMALRIYVYKDDLEKADEMMNRLEEVVNESGGNAVERLTNVYISLGVQLENRLKQLRIEGKNEEITSNTESFTKFLERIRKRENLNFQTLNWVANTYTRFGNGLSDQLSETPAEAKTYYARAVETYAEIQKKIKDDPSWAPANAVHIINKNLAEALRGLGLYEESLKYLKRILDSMENNVEIQIEAAKTYQAWGKIDPKYYAMAIQGGQRKPNGQNQIWGWAGIITRTAKRIDTDEKIRNVYYEAQYNRFYCMYEVARKETDKAKREKNLTAAKVNLERLYQLRSDLGGPNWFPKLDSLYKKIRQTLGENNPSGLKSYKPQEVTVP